MEVKFLGSVWVFFTLLQLAASQCTILTTADLSGPRGLIFDALLAASNATSVTNVTLSSWNLVCLSTGGSRGTFSSASLVAEYRINDGGSGSVVSQFEFACDNNGTWGTVVSGSSDGIITSPPDASLNTTLRTDCSLCLNSQRPESSNNNSQHCEECLNCVGLNLCTATSCCNVFGTDNQCALQCPPNSATDSNSICSCLSGYTGADCTVDLNDCDPNPCRNGGQCTDRGADDFLCSCAAGYGGETCQDLMCASPCQNGGTCALVNGNVTCECAAGFEGTACQSVASTEGCDTSCFIAIIVVVVGLVLFVTVTIIIVTTVTACKKDKKIKKYNVHTKKRRRKRTSPSKKSAVIPSTSELEVGPHQAHTLRVTLEPLNNGMDDGPEDRVEDGRIGEQDIMGNAELNWQWPHSAPGNDIPSPQTDNISMDVSNF